jgi:hypothetical protein
MLNNIQTIATMPMTAKERAIHRARQSCKDLEKVYLQAPFSNSIEIYSLTALSRHEISSLQKYLKDIARMKLKEETHDMKFFSTKPEPAQKEEEEEDDDDTDEYKEEKKKAREIYEEERKLYYELKDRDFKSELEIDVYLNHHTYNDMPLTDSDKDFLRHELLRDFHRGESRFTTLTPK